MPRIRLIIDTLMFVCIAALAGIGFLLKYVFLSGQEAQVVYGARVEQLLWGLSDHSWGTIHLIIGFVMAGLLVFHIILNWKTIVAMFQRLVKNRMLQRVVLPVFVFITIAIVVAPFFLSPTVVPRDDEGGGQWGEPEYSQGLGQRQNITVP